MMREIDVFIYVSYIRSCSNYYRLLLLLWGVRRCRSACRRHRYRTTTNKHTHTIINSLVIYLFIKYVCVINVTGCYQACHRSKVVIV